MGKTRGSWMIESYRRAVFVLVGIGAVGFAGPVAAGTCGGARISQRFVEAAELCNGNPQAQTTSVATVPSVPTYTPVAVTSREPVSVRMPGYRQRLAVAEREVRARGGRGAPPALVTAIAHRYRINPRLLASMMRVESAGDPGAVSHKGALGLMQVMPATARSMGVRDPKAMLTNPVLAISTGAAYLKRMQAQFGNNVPLVVAAYNAGPGAVLKYKRQIPRYRETQGYVRNVMGGFQGR